MKKIIVVILVVFYLLLIAIEANALTNKEQRTLVKEITKVCQEYNKPCKVSIIEDKRTQAMTSSQGEIFFTKKLLDKVTYEEAYGVGLHEVGHHILNHFTNGQSKHYNEFEADRFATWRLISSGKNNTLPNALFKIVPKRYWDYATETHPSTVTRIRLMMMYETKYYKRMYDSRKKI